MEQVAVQFPKLGLNFTISREAFVIGDFAVYWYAILIAVGALLAVIYAMTQAKKYGIDPDKLLDLGIVGLFFGIIGARLYYVLFNIENYTSLAQVFNIRDGGLAIYGGLILGVLSAFIASRINKTRFLPSLDIAAGGFLIGQAIGRWGNFVNQEAFGTNTDSIFGMYSEKTQEYLESVGWELFKQGIDIDPSAPVHPCFLYESVWCIVGFLLVLLYRKFRKFDGEIILFYAAWYGSGRAFIEGLRTDSLMIGNFRVSQILSIAIAAAAVITIITLRIRISKKRIDDPDYLKLYVDTEESRAQFMLSDEAALIRAEEYLSNANSTLAEAEKHLNLIVMDGGDVVSSNEQDSDEDLSSSQSSLEELATELSDPEKVLELIDKQIELALMQISMASTLLDRFAENDKSADDAEIQESEQDDIPDEDKPTDISERIAIACEQIESSREYIGECFEVISSVRERLELAALQEEPQQNEQEEPLEEVHDSVSDEADEMDIPSPHANK